MAWLIEIPGEPHAQKRPAVRVIEREGRSVPIVYDRAVSRDWKAQAAWHMRKARGNAPPLVGPVVLSVTAYFTCPASQYQRATRRPERWHTKRPDGDNVLKAVKDAAKGVLWLDDSQVAVASVAKIIAAQGEAPRVVLAIASLHGDVGRVIHDLAFGLGLSGPPRPPASAT